MIDIYKNCETCAYKQNNQICKKYCIDFKNHEFDCNYCIYKLIQNEKFCELENDDGSQNCCGDHFEFNSKIFLIKM